MAFDRGRLRDLRCFLGFGSKAVGPKVGILEKDGVILTNEFLFLDQSHTLPTVWSGFEVMACLWRPPFSPIQMKVKIG